MITAKSLEPEIDLRNAEVFNRTLFTRDDQIFQQLNAGINAGQHEGGGKSLEIRRFGFNLDRGGVNGGLKVLVDDVQQNQGTQGHGQGYPAASAWNWSRPMYDMVVTVGVGSIKGTYKGRVELAEQTAPRSFTLRASGAAPGTVSAECRMLLVDEAAARTRVEADADAVVGGVVGGVGQRMLGGVARKLAGQFFSGMNGVLTRGAATAAVPGEQAEVVPAATVVHPTTGPVTAFPIAYAPGQLGTSSAAMALAAGLTWPERPRR